jgi:hypothetical protein
VLHADDGLQGGAQRSLVIVDGALENPAGSARPLSPVAVFFTFACYTIRIPR